MSRFISQVLLRLEHRLFRIHEPQQHHPNYRQWQQEIKRHICISTTPFNNSTCREWANKHACLAGYCKQIPELKELWWRSLVGDEGEEDLI